MPSITIKNIPDELYEKIKSSASSNYRSINGEILYRLYKSLNYKSVDPNKLIEKIKNLQRKMEYPELTEDILEEAKKQGRP